MVGTIDIAIAKAQPFENRTNQQKVRISNVQISTPLYIKMNKLIRHHHHQKYQLVWNFDYHCCLDLFQCLSLNNDPFFSRLNDYIAPDQQKLPGATLSLVNKTLTVLKLFLKLPYVNVTPEH